MNKLQLYHNWCKVSHGHGLTKSGLGEYYLATDIDPILEAVGFHSGDFQKACFEALSYRTELESAREVIAFYAGGGKSEAARRFILDKGERS